MEFSLSQEIISYLFLIQVLELDYFKEGIGFRSLCRHSLRNDDDVVSLSVFDELVDLFQIVQSQGVRSLYHPKYGGDTLEQQVLHEVEWTEEDIISSI